MRYSAADLIGKTYGRLVIQDVLVGAAFVKRRVVCLCSCGRTTTTDLYHVLGGIVRSCGCLSREISQTVNRIPDAELLGRRFHRLVISEVLPSVANGIRKCVCACDCGGVATVALGNLRNGHSRSCGCLQVDTRGKAQFIHGDSKSAEWNIWCAMRHRCTAKKGTADYKNYSGRGIKVCKRWRESFTAFLADMGRRPSSKYSIERENNNGNYEPGNCHWATAFEQAANVRSNVRVTINGVTRIMKDWCRIYGVGQSTVNARIRRGWDTETAITTPTRPIQKPTPTVSLRTL